jgi:isopentenyl-diphosphate delta-isomerase
MGIDVELEAIGRFHYIAHFDNGLVENEVDHVLLGYFENETIPFNHEEVETYRWITIDALRNELSANPDKFTPWLGQALSLVEKHLKNQ